MSQIKLVHDSIVSGKAISLDERWLKFYRRLFKPEGYIFHATAIDRLNGKLASDLLKLDADTIQDFMFRWDIKDFHRTKLAFFKLGEGQILDIHTHFVLDLSDPMEPILD